MRVDVCYYSEIGLAEISQIDTALGREEQVRVGNESRGGSHKYSIWHRGCVRDGVARQ
jgi:hypothetical protein